MAAVWHHGHAARGPEPRGARVASLALSGALLYGCDGDGPARKAPGQTPAGLSRRTAGLPPRDVPRRRAVPLPPGGDVPEGPPHRDPGHLVFAHQPAGSAAAASAPT